MSGHLGGMYNTMAEQRKGWEEIEREINSINLSSYSERYKTQVARLKITNKEKRLEN